MPAPTPTPDHLSRRRKLLFSTGDLSTSIPLAILMFFQLFFLTDVAGLAPAYAAWYISYVILFNILVGPVFSAGSVTSEREVTSIRFNTRFQ